MVSVLVSAGTVIPSIVSAALVPVSVLPFTDYVKVSETPDSTKLPVPFALNW